MRLSTLGRLLGALCLAGSVTYAAAGSASASTPGWISSVTPLPPKVHNGADAGYQVMITNTGTSNISQLFLVSADPTTFVGGPDGGDCLPAGVTLKCSFGSLNAGASVTIVVAFATPSSGNGFTEMFQANTTGVSLNDKHHTSHGDTLDFTGVTDLTSDKDFGGGFDKDTSLVQDNGSIGKNNAQSTQVTPPVGGVIATVQDGPALNLPFSCDTNSTYCQGKTPFGEWSQVNVDNGAAQPSFFPITLMIYGKSVPNTVAQSSIALIHTDDNGNPIGTDPLLQCASGAPLENCIQVSKVGPNWKIVAWVDQNGGFKGMG